MNNEEVKKTFSELTEENKTILLMLANGMLLAQEKAKESCNCKQ